MGCWNERKCWASVRLEGKERERQKDCFSLWMAVNHSATVGETAVKLSYYYYYYYYY